MACIHPVEALEAGRDPDGLFILCAQCFSITRDMKTWETVSEKHYILHTTSGTYMNADECVYIVTRSNKQEQAVHEEDFGKAQELGAGVYEVNTGNDYEGEL
jgi:hypothetical protein